MVTSKLLKHDASAIFIISLDDDDDDACHTNLINKFTDYINIQFTKLNH